jgi:TatD DNase family protein
MHKLDWIDTHTHIYLPEFDLDRKEMIARSLSQGVSKLLMPNIDLDSFTILASATRENPDVCLPMMGLHPCSVDENYRNTLNILEKKLNEDRYYAVGEIGLDLYWDKSTFNFQQDAFRIQLQWAAELDLPVSVHTRDATEEALVMVEELQDGRLKGVFHCFGGSKEQAERLRDAGFYIGVGGVVTYKSSQLGILLSQIGLSNVVLETDAPYLSPVPHRGKRNEPSYIPLIGARIAECLGISLKEVAGITTQNALEIFRLN